VFNFNPVNLYQTPQEKFGGMVLGHYEVNEHLDVYARIGFSATNVTQQVAPSGIFGFTYFTPLANPFIGAQPRAAMIAQAEADRVAGLVNVAGVPDPGNPGDFLFHNWNDLNGNGVVDVADDLRISYRRRTVEFGNRSSVYDQNHFQFVVGSRGEIMNDWTYDVSFQRGETDRTDTSAGYTNLAAIENAIRTLDGVTCQNGDPACVPLDLFGGFGTITPAMAAANSATAIETSNYRQTIGTASFSGPIDAIKLPSADSPIAVSVGAEYRDEVGTQTPDECWKFQPSSCLGGAGGFRSPVSGAYNVTEFFGEAFLPLVSGRTGFEELNLELGIRFSDYDISGSQETWKVGFNWRPVESLLIRVMQQEATRAPNIGEIGSQNTTGLEDALIDPCSKVGTANDDTPGTRVIDPTLEALCLSTGMSLAQVGTIEDIVSGQINSIEGTDFDNLPIPETADTFTAGFVWTPEFDFVDNLVLTVDYYDIEVDDIIGEFKAQEVLDGCYIFGLASECAKIRRVGGTLTLPGSGTELFTTNLVFQQAEGIEIGGSFGVNLGNYGDLQVSATINHLLTAESQPADFLPVLDCRGRYGNSCENPSPETGWIQRTSWNFLEDFTVSYLWRHIGSTDIEAAQVDGTFADFRSIDDYNYVDLSGFWQVTDQIQLSVAINNLFGEDPPVVGNEAGSTSSNSGNTFPSMYDTLGTIYTAGFNFRF
jgi:outer membrane receptor protein involved in Fe transport